VFGASESFVYRFVLLHVLYGPYYSIRHSQITVSCAPFLPNTSFRRSNTIMDGGTSTSPYYTSSIRYRQLMLENYDCTYLCRFTTLPEAGLEKSKYITRFFLCVCVFRLPFIFFPLPLALIYFSKFLNVLFDSSPKLTRYKKFLIRLRVEE